MANVPVRARRLAVCCLTVALAISPIAWAADDADSVPTAFQPSPWVSGLLSLVMPGMGQFYAGQRERALLVFGGGLAVVGLKILTATLAAPDAPGVTRPRAAIDALDLVTTMALPTFWLWNVGDAVRAAQPSDLTASPSPMPGGSPPAPTPVVPSPGPVPSPH